MTLSRLSAWTFITTAGFALASMSATAQDTPIPTIGGAHGTAVGVINNELKLSRGIPADQLPEARKHFAAFAKYFGDIVAHPLVYKAAQDPSVKDPKGTQIPPLDGFGGIVPYLQRFILEPTPRNAKNVTKDQGDYIREMGVALDAVLKPVINENPEKIVRINATRLLAVACKSGATAHYPTVTELLKNANTPPYVKHYALVAAGNLLSAYDVYDYKSRRHSNGWKNEQQKGSGDKELAELVVEIEKCVLDPAKIMTNVPKFTAAEATRDQHDVVRFIRRAAIRALGEVRFAAIPGPDGKSMLYPAYTLAKVCVSDPALGVSPSPTECAEAVIGLCNLSKVRDGDIVKDYDADAAVEAVSAALVTFAERRAEAPQDKSIDWRGYGLRLSESFKNWRMMFDFGFNPLQPGNFSGTVPPAIDNLVQRVTLALLAPLEKTDGRVAIEDLKAFLKAQRERPNRKPLFADNPAMALYPQNKK